MKSKTIKHTPARIRAKIMAIEELHTLGRRSLEWRPGFGRAHEHGREARKKHVTDDGLRKARRFADPDKGYRTTDLLEVYSLFRAHHFSLSVEALVRLLAVPKAKRRQLTQLAIRRRWTTRRIELEIVKKFGTRRVSGGRQPVIPNDKEGVLAQIRMMCRTWERWHAELLRPVGNEKHGKASVLPRRLQKELQVVVGQLQKLETLASKALGLPDAVGHERAAGAK